MSIYSQYAWLDSYHLIVEYHATYNVYYILLKQAQGFVMPKEIWLSKTPSILILKN